MDYGRLIQYIVLGITLYLLWATLRWLVLPHLKIFPYIPPEALWVNAYNVLAALATACFWMVLAFMIALWAVWKAVRKFLPYTVLGIPVGKAILRASPLRDFTDAGIIPLINDIYNVLYDGLRSGLPIKKMLKGVWEACRKFYRTSLSYVFKNIRTEYRIDERLARERNRKRKRDTIRFADGPDRGPDPDPEERAETADEDLMRKEVDDAYQQCLEENAVAVEPDAGVKDRVYAAARNGTVKTTCGIQKMATYAQLMNYREL